MTEEQIKKIQQAVKLLNECLSAVKRTKQSSPKRNDTGKIIGGSKSKEYSGPKGGALLFIEQGFFKNKKTLEETHSALDKDGYVYKKDVVRIILDRLSKPGGPLIKIEEGGKKLYVERK
jgi:hypothetical protein